MHPYRMQQLIKQRGKDEVINVRQRTSIYQTIERLTREGLITVGGTSRDEKRPERTVYELTDRGRQTAVTWLREMLSTPESEYPEFPAALSLLPLLSPEDAQRQLEARAVALGELLAAVQAQSVGTEASVPRLFLIESEYQRAMLATELDWVQALVEDLQKGRLTWSEEWVRAVAASSEGETDAHEP